MILRRAVVGAAAGRRPTGDDRGDTAVFRAGAMIATMASYQRPSTHSPLAVRRTTPSGCSGLASTRQDAHDDVGVGVRSPRRLAGTAPRLPTVRNIADATGLACAACRTGIGRGWKCWRTPAPTCWPSKQIPDVDEAEALVNLVRSLGVPAWLS